MYRNHLSGSKRVIIMVLNVVFKKQKGSLFLGICLLFFLLLLSPLLIHITYAAKQTTNSTMIHGGGMTSIVCPDGSSVDTDLSFVVINLVMEQF